MEPGPGHAGHRDAGLGVSLGLLARACGHAGDLAATGGVSTGAIAVACATGRFRRKREERSIAGSPHAARRHASA